MSAWVSADWVSWVFNNSEAKNAERLVLIVIASHCDSDGSAWPGIASIAKHAGLSEKHAKRCIRALVDQGRLVRSVNGAPDTRIPRNRRPNLYQVVRLEDSRGVQMGPSGGYKCDLLGGTDRTPKQSLEESLEEEPLTPEGESAPSLFETTEVTPRPEKQRAARKGKRRTNIAVALNPVAQGQFDLWWQNFPRQRRGSKAGAMKAWREASEAGVTSSQLSKALSNYLEFLQHYEQAHGTECRFVCQGSSFIREKWIDYEDGFDPNLYAPDAVDLRDGQVDHSTYAGDGDLVTVL